MTGPILMYARKKYFTGYTWTILISIIKFLKNGYALWDDDRNETMFDLNIYSQVILWYVMRQEYDKILFINLYHTLVVCLSTRWWIPKEKKSREKAFNLICRWNLLLSIGSKSSFWSCIFIYKGFREDG